MYIIVLKKTNYVVGDVIVKQTIILLFSTLTITTCLGFAFLYFAYVNINGVTVRIIDTSKYEEIVESQLEQPTIIVDGTKEMNECIKRVLSGEYHFSLFDAFQDVQVATKLVLDEDRFRELIKEYNETAEPSVNAYINEDIKEVVPEVYGSQVDEDNVVTLVNNAIKNNGTVQLSNARVKPDIDKGTMQEYLNKYEEINNWSVSYSDPDIKISVPDGVVKISKDGSLDIENYDFIDDMLSGVSKRYNTIGKQHTFINHNGDTIQVSGGTLGDVVDSEKESEELLELFKSGQVQENRVPIYSKKVNETFDEYIEVSLEEQHVWYWKDGQVIMESDCVSGTKDTSRATPTGFWYMDIVMPGKMLHPGGEEKGTWVDRWMRFSPDGCGLHDATWRGKFGGNIYTYNGSHGCVNLPKNFAFELYEYAYIGMPVIVY